MTEIFILEYSLRILKRDKKSEREVDFYTITEAVEDPE